MIFANFVCLLLAFNRVEIRIRPPMELRNKHSALQVCRVRLGGNLDSIHPTGKRSLLYQRVSSRQVLR